MDQIKIGKFIASCRKEHGMTQAVLAEKLGISDRAVSKWETGKSMPDSGIMLELCEYLKINVNELLSGERIMAEAYDKIAEKNLIELKRKDENNLSRNTVLSIIFTITMAVGILVCCICDLAVSGSLTWSLITLCSILVAWITVFPIIFFGKKGIVPALAAISVLMVPYLYILSRVIQVREIFSIGAVMAAVALAFFWIVYLICRRFRERKLLAAGLAFLCAIPFTFLINIILSKMLDTPVFDAWDLLSVLVLLGIAGAFIYGDRTGKKHHREEKTEKSE